MKEQSEKKQWHRWFGNLFKISLTPLGIEVQTEFAVMKEPPEADVVIIRRDADTWTSEQLKYLPDGIRDCRASHIIIEFKHTESVNEDALCKTLGYRIFYKIHNKLKHDDIQTFLVSSKTPADETRNRYGYSLEKKPGVYESEHELLSLIPVISLNDLADEPYNAFVKLFATKKKERLAAFRKLFGKEPVSMPRYVVSYVRKFFRAVFYAKEDIMENIETDFTREEMRNIMKNIFTPEELMSFFKETFKPEELLAEFEPEQRLAGLEPEQRLAGLEPEQRLAGLKPEQRLAGLDPEQRLAGLDLEQCLARFDPEEIKSYLQKIS